MQIKDKLKARLEIVNKEIEIYEENVIEEIQKEQIIPATSDLLMLRDLKEQQGLIKNLLETEEE